MPESCVWSADVESRLGREHVDPLRDDQIYLYQHLPELRSKGAASGAWISLRSRSRFRLIGFVNHGSKHLKRLRITAEYVARLRPREHEKAESPRVATSDFRPKARR